MNVVTTVGLKPVTIVVLDAVAVAGALAAGLEPITG